MTDIKDRAREYLAEHSEYSEVFGQTFVAVDTLTAMVEFAEQETKELKEKLECAERARDYWKDSSFDWRHKCTSRKPFKVAVKAQKQLTKAKEIMKRLVDLSNSSRSLLGGTWHETVREAEQFLSEVEK